MAVVNDDLTRIYKALGETIGRLNMIAIDIRGVRADEDATEEQRAFLGDAHAFVADAMDKLDDASSEIKECPV